MRKKIRIHKKITEFIIDIFDNLHWSTFKQFQIREKSTFSILRIFYDLRICSEIHHFLHFLCFRSAYNLCYSSFQTTSVA